MNKLQSFLALVAMMLLAIATSLPAQAIDDRQKDLISQNCTTIKQSLNQLQKVDSRTRAYLGTTYETLANKFITPLNLRLVKNNRPTFSKIQTNFSTEQQKFKENYTDYMRNLEELIIDDCSAHPEEFYKKLELVREKRAKLRASTVKMTKLSQEQYDAVVKLREEL